MLLILNENAKELKKEMVIKRSKGTTLDKRINSNVKLSKVITTALLLPEIGFEIDKDTYLDKDQIQSNKLFMKKISNYMYATNQGYLYNINRKHKNYGKPNAWGYMIASVKDKTTTVNNILYNAMVQPVGENVVHHLDHDKANNKLNNLACISREDNLRERFKYDKELGKKMASQRNKNYIYCSQNNTLYKNKSTMANQLGLLISAMNKVLDGTWSNYNGFTFRYLTNEEQKQAENYFIFNKSQKMVNISQITL